LRQPTFRARGQFFVPDQGAAADLAGVPCAATARTRDRAVHHYFDVNVDILQETITEDLPRLLEALPPIELGCRRCSPGSESTSTPEDAASAAISQPMARVAQSLA
jgi:hypothetical protein